MNGFRLNKKVLFQLGQDIRATEWLNAYELRNNLQELIGLLALFVPMVLARRCKDSLEALQKVCWHVGQGIGNLDQIRKDEIEDRARSGGQSAMYEDMTVDQVVAVNELFNQFLKRYLKAVGVFDLVAEHFPHVQDGEQPLFVPECWDEQWAWIATHFFEVPVTPSETSPA